MVQEFYGLKALIILEQLITSVVEKKKNNLNEQKVQGLMENQDRGSRIEDREIRDRSLY